MELQKGRPADTAGRMEKEIRTYDFLGKLGVEYDRVDHGPAMTMEDCKEADEILQATICKNLFLCNRQKTAFYLLMIPDTKVFHTKDLSAQIGPHGCLLQARNIWKNSWTLRRALSVSWD